MEGLIHRELLHARTAAHEWLLLDGEEFPVPRDGYVVSFTHFHEHGLTMPPHRFLLGLLHFYKIELQHLNPNGIQHITAFIALCEGYLGIEPHFNLWWHFFAVDLQKRKGPNQMEIVMPIGCTSIRLRSQWARDYIPMKLSTSNKGWRA